MANLYYREDLALSAFEVNSILEVGGEEGRHAVRVSRLRVGERTIIGNGSGVLGHGEVVSVERDRFTVRIDRVDVVSEPEQRVVLVQALAKGDRDERAVEQATEFGVDAILPWQASRSVSRWQAQDGHTKAQKGIAKWARIAREAAKQSMRARVPVVGEPLELGDLVSLAAQPDAQMLVLHPRGSERLSDFTRTRDPRSSQSIFLVVGPEGGITDSELDALEHAGAQVLALGDTVLRTSSAGPAAIAVLNVALSRW